MHFLKIPFSYSFRLFVGLKNLRYLPTAFLLSSVFWMSVTWFLWFLPYILQTQETLHTVPNKSQPGRASGEEQSQIIPRDYSCLVRWVYFHQTGMNNFEFNFEVIYGVKICTSFCLQQIFVCSSELFLTLLEYQNENVFVINLIVSVTMSM